MKNKVQLIENKPLSVRETDLEDGFYLSIYSCVNKYLNNLKHSLRHDQNMSLWEKRGAVFTLIHHWEFERITGYKHHNVSFYDKNSAFDFINSLLSEYSLSIDNIVNIFGTPEISNINHYYNKDLGIEYTYHSIAHLFTSLMIDSAVFYNEDILALSFDGGSDFLIDNDNYKDRCDFLGAFSSKGNIQYFHIPSPGPYWNALKERTGLEEGSLMALATATECKTLEKLYTEENLIRIFKYVGDSPNQFKFVDRIMERILSYTMNDAGLKFNFFDNRFTEYECKVSMAAKIIQEISLIQIDDVIHQAIDRFEFNPINTNISLSGGYALNCPTNTYLMHKYHFKRQLIAPCVNDGGEAIGMGLYHFYKNCDKIEFKLSHPYYGDKDDNINVLYKEPYNNFIESIEYTTNNFTNDILNAPIVWFDGRAEIGPRALGHRSILANPSEVKSKELLNLYKRRQWWRPVAPIILQEELENWFNDSFESPYMLNNFTIKDEKKDSVPAIIHLDQTARVQTINKNMDAKLYSCIKEFFQYTGIPILCNTSLNDQGEPIINKIEEALNFSLRNNIKIIYINGSRVALKNHSEFLHHNPAIRTHQYFSKYFNQVELKLSLYEYMLCFVLPQLSKYDIENGSDIGKIKLIIKKLRKMQGNINL